MADPLYELEVVCAYEDGQGVRILELRAPDRQPLASFSPGAHIDLYLQEGVIRQYSLFNEATELDTYKVAIARQENGRGGSAFVHDELSVGQRLLVSHPRNAFALAPQAEHHVLIAGGIGITPIYSMLQALSRQSHSWELHYAARSQTAAPLLRTMGSLLDHQDVHLYFDDAPPGAPHLDLASLLSQPRPGHHFYCCGPLGMLADYERHGAAWPPEQIHMERFGAAEIASTEGGFDVVLAKTGATFTVAPGQTILQTLLDAGIAVRYRCRDGVCGECEVGVIEGCPDHRDAVLSDDERQANGSMMICCSGSLGPRLVLDL